MGLHWITPQLKLRLRDYTSFEIGITGLRDPTPFQGPVNVTSLSAVYYSLFEGTRLHELICLLLFFKSLNEALEHSNVPVEIVDGFIGTIAVSIPWSALISDSTTMEIHNLELTIQPKQRLDSAGGLQG